MSQTSVLAPSAQAHDMPHLPWSRQAVIYQVNIRQFSAEGSFAAMARHLPRLKALGVDILWLMPWQPIGKLQRKGSLGSYYAIADYTGINPEFGSLADLKALVQQAHALGMKVLLDWVANHTAWDHPWASQHKDWYKLNAQGEVFPVTFNAGTPEEEQWSDVIALNYAQPALRRAMTEAMAYWVREVGLDGFRCDVAGLVPIDFWVQARRELDAIKPLFWLAEWSEPEMHLAFDMTYGWDLTDLMKKLAKGQASAKDLAAWVADPTPGKVYPRHAYRMRFTSNHDVNSWHGSDPELYGPAFGAMTVLSFTLPGMPLIYNGQEAGLGHRLAFFEKDEIRWGERPLEGLYRELINLKHAHPALAAGQYGAPVQVLESGNPAVFAFRRAWSADEAAKNAQHRDRVSVAVNLSDQAQTTELEGQKTVLPAWGWRILSASR